MYQSCVLNLLPDQDSQMNYVKCAMYVDLPELDKVSSKKFFTMAEIAVKFKGPVF